MPDSPSAPGRIAPLAHGRTLCYAEWGDPDGTPVVFFHGGSMSRLALLGSEGLLRDRRVRLITVDRPGIGGSSSLRHRVLVDWAEDVEKLADVCELDRFAVAGYSMGAPHALAAAHGLPHRVTAAGVISGMAPFDCEVSRTWSDGVTYRRAPILIRAFLALLVRKARGSPLSAARLWGLPRKPVDRLGIRRPEVLSQVIPALLEGARPGVAGFLDDFACLTRPWGFDPADIGTSVLVWHGEEDSVVPVAHGRWLAERIPATRATLYPGEGHFAIADHAEEMIDALTSAAQSDSGR